MSKFKIYVFLAVISMLVLYLLLPVGADYALEDVYTTSNAKNMFSRLTAEEFEERVESNMNPGTSNIVLPATMVKRDGRIDDSKLHITGAQVYSNGEPHTAFDLQSSDRPITSLCPTGNSNCDDIALIAPVSGTITKVNRVSTSHFNWYGKPNAREYNTAVVISGGGQWTGYDFMTLHLWSINPDLNVGDKINQGDFIGFLCSQGKSSGPHLHFEVMNGTAKVRLSDYIDKIVLHKTVPELELSKSFYPSFSKLVGFTEEQLDGVNSRPRYESNVSIK